MHKYGTRTEVWNGEARMTRGMLEKKDLMMSSTGRLVSKRKSEAAKKNYKLYGFNKRAAKTEQVEDEQDTVVEEAAKTEQQAKKPRKRRKRAKKGKTE